MVGAAVDLLALASLCHEVVATKLYFNAPHSYSLQSTYVGLAAALMSHHGGARACCLACDVKSWPMH